MSIDDNISQEIFSRFTDVKSKVALRYLRPSWILSLIGIIVFTTYPDEFGGIVQKEIADSDVQFFELLLKVDESLLGGIVVLGFIFVQAAFWMFLWSFFISNKASRLEAGLSEFNEIDILMVAQLKDGDSMSKPEIYGDLMVFKVPWWLSIAVGLQAMTASLMLGGILRSFLH